MCEFSFIADITIHSNELESFVHFCVFFKTDAINMSFSILFTVSLDVPRNVTWIKINCHQKGYYRVNYDKEDWEKLIELLKNDFMVRTVMLCQYTVKPVCVAPCVTVLYHRTLKWVTDLQKFSLTFWRRNYFFEF